MLKGHVVFNISDLEKNTIRICWYLVITSSLSVAWSASPVGRGICREAFHKEFLQRSSCVFSSHPTILSQSHHQIETERKFHLSVSINWLIWDLFSKYLDFLSLILNVIWELVNRDYILNKFLQGRYIYTTYALTRNYSSYLWFFFFIYVYIIIITFGFEIKWRLTKKVCHVPSREESWPLKCHWKRRSCR